MFKKTPRKYRSSRRIKLSHIILAAVFLLTSSFGNLIFLDLPSAAATSGSSFKIATYNVRVTDLDSWGKISRGSKILEYLKTVSVAGVQEMRDDSRAALKKGLGDVGYSKSKFDTAVDIFWKSDQFTLVNQGITTVLDHVKCGSDNDVLKELVWVRLRENATGREFYFMTTHLDVNTTACREKQIKNVLDAVSSTMVDTPVIFVGDMNSKTGSSVDNSITASGFTDAYSTATIKTNINSSSTVSGVGGSRRGGSPIDHIYSKNGVTISRIEIKDQEGSDHLPVEADVSVTGGSIPLTIGTYNILGYYHGDGTRYAPDRLKQIVTNISTMKYDVVGLQEYKNQASGNPKELMDELKALSPTMEMAYMSGKGDADQLNFIYNTATLKLVSDKAVAVGDSKSGCDGGTIYVRIARFSVIASGQEFMVVNVHTTSNHDAARCDTERLSVVKGAVTNSDVTSYTGPLFIVGDFNANPTGKRGDEKNVNAYMSGAGFGNARDIPGAIRKAGGVIDHVYYKISSIAPPASYEVLDCKNIPKGDPDLYNSSTTCASDHYPVKAVFGGGISQDGCHDPNDPQFSDWNINLYDPTCVATCSENTGGTMSGDTNAKKIATYLASKGLNAIAIAGILGNWEVESPGLSAFRQEGGKGWPSGGYGLAQWTAGRRTNGTNTGVVDILKKDSRTKDLFTDYYDAKYGDSPPDGGIPTGVPSEVNDAWLKVELDFMLEEFNQKQYDIGGGYTDVLKTAVSVNNGDNLKTALNGAKTATDAALIFTALFEKQGALRAIHDKVGKVPDSEIKKEFLASVSKRTSQAEKVVTDVQALVGGATTSPAGASCGAPAKTGVAIDGMMFPLQTTNKKYVGDGGGGKGSHLGGGTCPYYWAYDLMMNGSSEAKSAATSVKVVAITDGTISDKVTIKSYSLGGQPYGWQLGLEAADGSLFYYTHMLNRPTVQKGQAVKAGDLLETGVKNVNGEHLHIDESPKGKGRNGAFSTGISRSSCSRAQQGDFVELGPTLTKLWEAMP